MVHETESRRPRHNRKYPNVGYSHCLTANSVQSLGALASQLPDLVVQRFDRVDGLVDRRPEFTPFTLPALDALDFSNPAALLGVDLLAELALLSDWERLIDEFHAASFTNPILLGTVLAKVAPLPVATCEPMLIEEAHVSRDGNVVTVLSQYSGDCLAVMESEHTWCCFGQAILLVRCATGSPLGSSMSQQE